MQKGTALKWIQSIDENFHRYIYEDVQHGYNSQEGVHLSPFGVLFEFLNIPKKIAWDGVSFLYDKEQFAVPMDFAKRSKMKSNGEFLYDEIFPSMKFESNFNSPWMAFSSWLEKNYSVI